MALVPLISVDICLRINYCSHNQLCVVPDVPCFCYNKIVRFSQPRRIDLSYIRLNLVHSIYHSI